MAKLIMSQKKMFLLSVIGNVNGYRVSKSMMCVACVFSDCANE